MSDTAEAQHAPEPYAIDVTAAALSNAREKILEHRIVADLAALMMRRGTELEVMRGEFDAHGHDLVLEATGIVRHVQLKAMHAGGARRDVSVHVRLRSRPSGCVVWMIYDPLTLRVLEYRWFGEQPGMSLPDLGTKVARHSKCNTDGVKTDRKAHRLVGKRRFDVLTDLPALADRLFGPPRSLATSLVVAQLRQRFGAEWPLRVQQSLGAPEWNDSVHLAHLVDGYGVIEQLGVLEADDWLAARAGPLAGQAWASDLGNLWTTLFIEHRRWRFSSPFDPTGRELDRLNDMVRALHAAIDRELAAAPD